MSTVVRPARLAKATYSYSYSITSRYLSTYSPYSYFFAALVVMDNLFKRCIMCQQRPFSWRWVLVMVYLIEVFGYVGVSIQYTI